MLIILRKFSFLTFLDFTQNPEAILTVFVRIQNCTISQKNSQHFFLVFYLYCYPIFLFVSLRLLMMMRTIRECVFCAWLFFAWGTYIIGSPVPCSFKHYRLFQRYYIRSTTTRTHNDESPTSHVRVYRRTFFTEKYYFLGVLYSKVHRTLKRTFLNE